MTMPSLQTKWTRRIVLTTAASGVLTACSSPANQSASSPVLAPSTAGSATSALSGRQLIVYFSRVGENYFYGDRRNLTVGNTEVLALQLAELLGCDIHKLEAANPYPDSYDECVARNSREQEEEARPEITNPVGSLSGYGAVLIGSPIWNVQAPRIIRTFIDANDFTGITVAPFTTHAMSGLGGVPEEYSQSCRGAAAITEGLAVRGEEVEQARPAAEAWLRQIGLL